MVNTVLSDIWWKNAVVYCLDVETFVDSDGDGIGDFRGLTQRVNYLAGLGVTCIWLMPFYQTPNRDDGYDICDFYNVDPRLGSLGDFVEFMQEASERGMRVICDLVVNHTSTHHPWFQSARSDPESPYRDWYVWSEQPKENPQNVIFPNVEDSNWAYDDEAGLYYLHRFYREQPDLNTANNDVLAEIHRIMGFWLQLGVSGFRVDAVPYLIERIGEQDESYAHRLLEDMRTFLQRRTGHAILLGEVNLEPDRTPRYFGDECDELTMIANFYGNASMYLALVRGSRQPLVRALAKLSGPPRDCQWANFVRNHDEANFSRITDDEREEVLDALAPDDEERIYGRGIRRRLPPIVDGDERRMRLLYSLMFTLPGTPMIYYGEEIGMGDDLSLSERLPMRTPMQWSGRPHAGFSTAEPGELIRPVVDEGPYRYQEVNVADQRQDPDSLLTWFQRAIRIRKENPEFGVGEPTVLDVDDDAVLALRYDHLGETVVAMHNLSPDEHRVRIVLDQDVQAYSDLFGDRRYAPLDPKEPVSTLQAYGYRWLRVEHAGHGMSVA